MSQRKRFSLPREGGGPGWRALRAGLWVPAFAGKRDWAGLDPAKYNAIGKAAAADATLRTKVQTAMSKYAPEPTEG